MYWLNIAYLSFEWHPFTSIINLKLIPYFRKEGHTVCSQAAWSTV